jgi:uncharacterized protein (DUF302 family)
MKYIVKSNKSVKQAVDDLQQAVVDHEFGVLHIHNLKATLKSKGIDFGPECQILEICNPHQANKVLTQDMDINMALPCRISVYEDNGQTLIGMLRPEQLLAQLSESDVLAEVAQEVEETSIAIIQQAR